MKIYVRNNWTMIKLRTWLYINSWGLTQLARLFLWLFRPFVKMLVKYEKENTEER